MFQNMYTMREMVLPEDELKTFDEPLELRLEATNQQLKKWLLRWRPVIYHSMHEEGQRDGADKEQTNLETFYS